MSLSEAPRHELSLAVSGLACPLLAAIGFIKLSAQGVIRLPPRSARGQVRVMSPDQVKVGTSSNSFTSIGLEFIFL